MGKREVPANRRPEHKELGFIQNQPAVGWVEPSDQMQVEMARDGMRYGDPELPRYATGRADGRAPHLSTQTDFTLRTKRGAGGPGDPKIGHPSAKGLVQPHRRSVW